MAGKLLIHNADAGYKLYANFLYSLFKRFYGEAYKGSLLLHYCIQVSLDSECIFCFSFQAAEGNLITYVHLGLFARSVTGV